MSSSYQEESESSKLANRLGDLRVLARSISPQRADAFLQAIVNLDLRNEKGALQFLERFSELLPRRDFKLGLSSSHFGAAHELDPMRQAQRVLSMAWRRPTVLSRQLGVLQLVGSYFSLSAFEIEGAIYHGDELWAAWLESRVDPFLLVSLRALQITDRMRYCPSPTCLAPYFIARRRSQKYCSDTCALPAQRELKRAWWAEHGDVWRAERTAKQVRRKSQQKRGK
jgi:hypothetical protein